jgi:hypothetical protein
MAGLLRDSGVDQLRELFIFQVPVLDCSPELLRVGYGFPALRSSQIFDFSPIPSFSCGKHRGDAGVCIARIAA